MVAEMLRGAICESRLPSDAAIEWKAYSRTPVPASCCSSNSPKEVRPPDAKRRRQLARLGKSDAQLRQQVVAEEEHERENHRSSLASSFGRKPQRNANQHENDAGKGVGEARVEFDARGSRVAGPTVRTAPDLWHRQRVQRRVCARDVGVVLILELDGDVGGGKSGDVVLVGIGLGDLVLAAIDQVQAKTLRVAADGRKRQSLLGGGDVGILLLGQVGEEDMIPDDGPFGWLHVLYKKDVVLEVLVEDARLNGKGDLRGLELILQPKQVAGRARRKVERIDQTERERRKGENRDDAHERQRSNAAGAHGGHFAVGGKTAQSEKNSRQNRHGKRDR